MNHPITVNRSINMKHPITVNQWIKNKLGVAWDDEAEAPAAWSTKRRLPTAAMIGTFNDESEFVQITLISLQLQASMHDKKDYGPENEKETLVYLGGEISMISETSGFSWVGVCGGNAGPSWVAALNVRSSVLFLPLAYMTGNQNDSASFCKLIPPNSRAKPFAVVSVAPYESPQLTQAEHARATLAISFLKESLEGHSYLPSGDVRQLTIRALRLLMGEKYTSDDQVKVAGFVGFGAGIDNYNVYMGKMKDVPANYN